MFLFIFSFECTDFKKARHYRFTKSDLTPGEKRRISQIRRARVSPYFSDFDHAPGREVNPFSKIRPHT